FGEHALRGLLRPAFLEHRTLDGVHPAIGGCDVRLHRLDVQLPEGIVVRVAYRALVHRLDRPIDGRGIRPFHPSSSLSPTALESSSSYYYAGIVTAPNSRERRARSRAPGSGSPIARPPRGRLPCLLGLAKCPS